MLKGRHCSNWKNVEVVAVRTSKAIVLARNMRQARVSLMRKRSKATEILTKAMDQFQRTWQMKIRRMAVNLEAAGTCMECCPKPELQAIQTMMYMAMAMILSNECQFRRILTETNIQLVGSLDIPLLPPLSSLPNVTLALAAT